MVFCWIPFPSIIPSDGDDDLANQITYPLYIPGSKMILTSTINTIIRSLKLEDTDTTKLLTFDGTSITQTGGAKSLHNLSGLGDYSVTPGKTAKLILILESLTVDCQFKVWESPSADTASGTAKYTYTGNEFDGTSLITVCPDWDITPKTFAATKFITIEVTSSGDSLEVLAAIVVES